MHRACRAGTTRGRSRTRSSRRARASAAPSSGNGPVPRSPLASSAAARDQRPELVPEPVEDGPHLGGRRARLEVVEEDVVRVVAPARSTRCTRASARAGGRARAGTRRSRSRRGRRPTPPSPRTPPSSARRRDRPGTRRAFSQSRRVTRIRLASSESYGSDASSSRSSSTSSPIRSSTNRSCATRSSVARRSARTAAPRGRHHHHLIPVEQRRGRAEIGDLSEPAPQLGESLAPSLLLSTRDSRESTALTAPSGGHDPSPSRSPERRRSARTTPSRQIRVSISISLGRPADDVEAVRLAEPVRARSAEARRGGEHERAGGRLVERLERVSLDGGALVDVAAEDQLGSGARRAPAAPRPGA